MCRLSFAVLNGLCDMMEIKYHDIFLNYLHTGIFWGKNVDIMSG